MKSYPHIVGKISYEFPVHIFDKLDGSNIRAEWSKKRGFYKFGTRKQMIDENHKQFGESVTLIRNKYEDDLAKIFRAQRYESAVSFFEFLGPNSFAGHHLDEPHDVTLFEVSPHKQNMLAPKEYLKLFGDLDIAQCLHVGKINKPIIEQIHEGTFPGMTFEGVVCKAKIGKKFTPLQMFKVKNFAWYLKLKTFCKGDEDLYKKLL